MKLLARLALMLALGASALCAQTPAAAPAKPVKNWTPPAYKIYAQTLSDQIMAAHPELISVTFHGVPPGLSKVYTMFAGSFPERIGNPDDPDDVMIIELGITIIDPRWHRP
jgi:ABC-type glycerol-3-phosphate transport system substrate-binding protein